MPVVHPLRPLAAGLAAAISPDTDGVALFPAFTED
jgi:hypothetical protein